jgi:hypothetical protein
VSFRNLKPRFAAASFAVAIMSLVAALVLPAAAQLIWEDDDEFVSDRGGLVPVTAHPYNVTSYARTYRVTFVSSGPSVSGPATITVPAGSMEASADFEIGPGEPMDVVSFRTEDTGICWTKNVFLVP